MIINDSTVEMYSSRRYQSFSGLATKGGANNFQNKIAEKISVEDPEKKDVSNDFRITSDILFRLLQKIIYSKLRGNMYQTAGEGNTNNPVMYENISSKSYFEEYEQTTFNSTGIAHTKDGRTINFNVELSMTRAYMEYANIEVNRLQNALMDPLVINVDGGVAGLSDKKFTFDLDGDGKNEEISMLKSGSGFLAYDKNNDGIINDGNELFGTKSGDGFADLSKYDTDNNGWIDEADKIYNNLKVWFKDENGRDVLLGLKEANVGAIFLGNENTQFTNKSISGLNGVIRKTGIFLKESGGVGTIQHVDFNVIRN